MKLRLISAHEVPAATRVDGDLFGGISGIDYDARRHEWYLVSDDRSEYAPARFFVARFDYDSDRLKSVTLRASVHFASRRYPSASTPGGTSDWIDAESIRVDRRGGYLLVASEGDAQRATPSWVRRVDRDGYWLGAIALPPSLASTTLQGKRGPRPNRSFEGLTFAPDGALWIALESPLLQDGEEATPLHGVDVRLTRMQWPKGASAQYVYAANAAPAHDPQESADNGISEILALGARKLLVLERSGIKAANGEFQFHVRLYCSDLSGATDVASDDSLVGHSYTRASKHLLLDFAQLHDVPGANLEAMAWGPNLKDGRRSLVFASDNNFARGVATQLLFFAIEP